MNSRSFHPSHNTQCEKGQTVRVRDVIWSRWAGQCGIIVKVKPDNRGKRILGKYVVQFPDNDQEEFWGIQLEMDFSDHRV